MLNEKIQKLIDDGYEIKMSDYISEGFDLFKKYPGGFIGFLIIVGTISIVGAFIPFVGSIISVVVQPPLFIGFFIVADKIKYGETYQFSDFFSGFNKNISGLVLASLVGAILIVLGFICLILPGIYLAISYGFSSQLVYFKGFEFWSALETSRKIITKQWFAFFVLAILLGLLNLVGLICLGVGLLVTIPATFLAMYAAFDNLVGVRETSTDTNIADHLVTS